MAKVKRKNKFMIESRPIKPLFEDPERKFALNNWRLKRRYLTEKRALEALEKLSRSKVFEYRIRKEE